MSPPEAASGSDLSSTLHASRGRHQGEPRRRPPLPEDRIATIRRERRAPRITQWDYLHLRTLRDALRDTFEVLDVEGGPVLDLYCGTQPYRELIPWEPVVGVDVDRHFGRTDVIASGRLPFRNECFSLVLCTQALYLVDDEALAVAEMHRVTRPGGWAVITVPRIFRPEVAGGRERRHSERSLRALFGGWSFVDVRSAGGPGAGAAFYAGRLLRGVVRRVSPAAALVPVLAVGLNAAGTLIDVVARPLQRRVPASMVLAARR